MMRKKKMMISKIRMMPCRSRVVLETCHASNLMRTHTCSKALMSKMSVGARSMKHLINHGVLAREIGA